MFKLHNVDIRLYIDYRGDMWISHHRQELEFEDIGWYEEHRVDMLAHISGQCDRNVN